MQNRGLCVRPIDEQGSSGLFGIGRHQSLLIGFSYINARPEATSYRTDSLRLELRAEIKVRNTVNGFRSASKVIATNGSVLAYDVMLYHHLVFAVPRY